MSDKDTLIEFPCDFPIKAIGKNHVQFVDDVRASAKKYYPDIQDNAIQSQISSNGNFISVTLTVYAEDKATLDKLYTELSQLKDVKMVL